MKTSKLDYKSIIENLHCAYMYCSLLLDSEDKAIDYKFIDANTAYEDMVGIPLIDIINKSGTDIYPNLKSNGKEHFKLLYDIAINGKKKEFEYFSDKTNKWYQVNAYSPQKGYFISIFNEITILKKIEERIEKTENKYKSIIDTAQEGIWQINSDHKTIYVNQRMADILGYTREEMHGKRVHNFIFCEHLQNYLLSVEEIKKGKKLTLECRLKHKNNSVVWALLSVSPVFDENKRFISTFGMFTDITQRKKAEEEATLTQKKIQSILKAVEDHIVLLDTEGKLLVANDTFLNSKKMKLEDIVNTCVFDLMMPETREKRIEYLNKVKLTGEVLFLEDKAQGKIWYTSHYPVKDDYGKIVSIAVISRDITKLRRIEDEFIKSEERFRSYFLNSPNPIVLANKEGMMIEANPASNLLTGYSTEETLNMSIFEFLAEKDLEKGKNLFRILVDEGHASSQITIKHKSCKEILIQIDGVKLTDNEYAGFWREIK